MRENWGSSKSGNRKIDLLLKAKEGCMESKNELQLYGFSIVDRFFEKYGFSKEGYEDLYQSSLLYVIELLNKAIEKGNYPNNALFLGIFRNSIIRFIKSTYLKEKGYNVNIKTAEGLFESVVQGRLNEDCNVLGIHTVANNIVCNDNNELFDSVLDSVLIERLLSCNLTKKECTLLYKRFYEV